MSDNIDKGVSLYAIRCDTVHFRVSLFILFQVPFFQNLTHGRILMVKASLSSKKSSKISEFRKKLRKK